MKIYWNKKIKHKRKEEAGAAVFGCDYIVMSQVKMNAVLLYIATAHLDLPHRTHFGNNCTRGEDGG